MHSAISSPSRASGHGAPRANEIVATGRESTGRLLVGTPVGSSEEGGYFAEVFPLPALAAFAMVAALAMQKLLMPRGVLVKRLPV